MDEPVVEGMITPDLGSEAGDSAAAVAALAVAAISGLLMGFVLQGAIAVAFTMAALAPALGFVGWWLRGIFDDGRRADIQALPRPSMPDHLAPSQTSRSMRC